MNTQRKLAFFLFIFFCIILGKFSSAQQAKEYDVLKPYLSEMDQKKLIQAYGYQEKGLKTVREGDSLIRKSDAKRKKSKLFFGKRKADKIKVVAYNTKIEGANYYLKSATMRDSIIMICLDSLNGSTTDAQTRLKAAEKDKESRNLLRKANVLRDSSSKTQKDSLRFTMLMASYKYVNEAIVTKLQAVELYKFKGIDPATLDSMNAAVDKLWLEFVSLLQKMKTPWTVDVLQTQNTLDMSQKNFKTFVNKKDKTAPQKYVELMMPNERKIIDTLYSAMLNFNQKCNATYRYHQTRIGFLDPKTPEHYYAYQTGMSAMEQMRYAKSKMKSAENYYDTHLKTLVAGLVTTLSTKESYYLFRKYEFGKMVLEAYMMDRDAKQLVDSAFNLTKNIPKSNNTNTNSNTKGKTTKATKNTATNNNTKKNTTQNKTVVADAEKALKLVFKVQIATFDAPVALENFKGYKPDNIQSEKMKSTKKVAYLIGDFKLAKAESSLNDAKNKGYKDAFIVAYLNGGRITLQEAKDKIKSYQQKHGVKQTKKTEIDDQEEDANEKDTISYNNAIETDESLADKVVKGKSLNTIKGLVYTIQIGYFDRAIKYKEINNLTPIYADKYEDNLTRYTTGLFKTEVEAVKNLKIVKAAGVEDAFVTAYMGGKRVTIEEARKHKKGSATNKGNKSNKKTNIAKVEDESDEGSTDVKKTDNKKKASKDNKNNTDNFASNTKIKDEPTITGSKENIVFKVQMPSGKEQISAAETGTYESMAAGKKLEKLKNEDGLVVFTIGDFKDYEEAKKFRESIVKQNKDGFITAYQNGKKISVRKAQKLLKLK